MVVELSWRQAASAAAEDNVGRARSVYLGWTGMQSQTKLAPIVDKKGINRSGGRQEQDTSAVELDSTLARMLGISNGQKVCLCNRILEVTI